MVLAPVGKWSLENHGMRNSIQSTWSTRATLEHSAAIAIAIAGEEQKTSKVLTFKSQDDDKNRNLRLKHPSGQFIWCHLGQVHLVNKILKIC